MLSLHKSGSAQKHNKQYGILSEPLIFLAQIVTGQQVKLNCSLMWHSRKIELFCIYIEMISKHNRSSSGQLHCDKKYSEFRRKKKKQQQNSFTNLFYTVLDKPCIVYMRVKLASCQRPSHSPHYLRL